MELFRSEPTLQFEKTATKHMLSDNPATWVSELTAALYKQHDWLGKYSVNVSIESQDDSMGYLYGMFIVASASDVPPPALNVVRSAPVAAQEEKPAEEEETSVRIPIIVSEKKAFSFDVFISPDGKFLPLSEPRVSAELFDATTFQTVPRSSMEAASRGTEDDNFDPGVPSRGFGGSVQGVFGASQGAIKTSSARSIFDKIEPDEQLVDAFLEKFGQDEAFIATVRKQGVLKTSLRKLATAAKVHAAPRVNVGADAADLPMLLTKVDGGFTVKVASGKEQWTERYSNADAGTLPLEHRQTAITHGMTLLNAAPEALPLMVDTSRVKTASVTGAYSVIKQDGTVEDAVVLADVIGLDGRERDSVLVLGASGNGFQEKVAGIHVSSVDMGGLQDSPIKGSGFFWFPKLAKASEPLDIEQAVTSGGSTYWRVQHPLHGAGMLTKTKTASPIHHVQDGDQCFLIPEDSVFVPFDRSALYVEDDFTAQANAHLGFLGKTASLISDGTSFSFRGELPFEEKEDLTKGDALLALGALGDSGGGAREKLAAASHGEEISFYINPVAEVRFAEVTFPNSYRHFATECHTELAKEAAALASAAGQDTVDSVLSLNFITPENVQGYFDSMPELEMAVSKLAELLVGVRLGLQDVPEAAVSSAVSGIERALQGLRKLQMRQDYTLKQ